MPDPVTSKRLTYDPPRDLVLNPEGSIAYAAVLISRKIEAYSTLTGELLSSWDVSRDVGSIGGMDVTADGRYVVFTDRTRVSFVRDQNGIEHDVVAVHRLDTVTGAVRNYNFTTTGFDTNFFDLAVLADGQVLLTQSFKGSSASLTLKTLDLDTGVFTQLSQTVRQNSVLSLNADRTHVLVGEAKEAANARIDEFVLNPDGTLGLVGTHVSTGSNRGVQALSSDAQHAVNFVYGTGLLLFDSNLTLVENLTTRYPDWLYSVSGVAFDATGEHLLVLDYSKSTVVKLSTSTWEVVSTAKFPAPGPFPGLDGRYGNNLLVNADGYVTVVDIGLNGSLLLSPDAFHEPGVQLAGTAGDDHLNGRSGDDTLDGFDGADILMGLAGDDTLTGGAGNDFLDGGWGADKMSGGAGNDRYVVGNTGDVVTELANEGNDTVETSITYKLGANVENLIAQTGAYWYNGGPDGNINLTGNALNNRIAGNAGNNVINGGDGDDEMSGGGGRDTIVGNAPQDLSVDTLVLSRPLSSYTGIPGETYFIVGFGETYRMIGVEQVRVGDGPVMSVNAAFAQIGAFDGMRYIAGQADLIARFGPDAAQGTAHFASNGFLEERDPLAFDPYSYLASYSDLQAAYGTDGVAASRHYIIAGAAEGRSITFDALNYIATYSDLRATFGTDASAAALHYLRFGEAEGRAPGFDTYGYLASNTSVLAAVGTDLRAAEREYIEEGAALGYRTDTFDALSYIASYNDLTAAFGLNETAGVRHFVDHGFTEGREITFEGLSYIASYDDLIDAIGVNEEGGVIHFLRFGSNEHREVTFDPEAYAAANPDLLAVYGHDDYALARHYILWGHDEGREVAPTSADPFGM